VSEACVHNYPCENERLQGALKRNGERVAAQDDDLSALMGVHQWRGFRSGAIP
jgi:hypothetical protein